MIPEEVSILLVEALQEIMLIFTTVEETLESVGQEAVLRHDQLLKTY